MTATVTFDFILNEEDNPTLVEVTAYMHSPEPELHADSWHCGAYAVCEDSRHFAPADYRAISEKDNEAILDKASETYYDQA